ncbi:hypothetical protein [Desulforamulus ruminis]|nr:hypothetical protein [Desulforamulus ruminis]
MQKNILKVTLDIDILPMMKKLAVLKKELKKTLALKKEAGA